MRRMGVATFAVIALLAFGGAVAGTASAKRLVLSEDGIALAPGDGFEIYGVDNLAVTTSTGAIECEDPFHETSLELGVITNSAPKDELQTSNVIGGRQEPCHAPSGANASVSLVTIGTPLKLGANGKAVGGPVELAVDYELVVYHEQRYPDVECVYRHKSLKGTNTATAAPQKLEIELGGGLALDVSSSSFNAKHVCPKKADMTFSLDSYEFGVIEEQTQT